ncbi:hypothetical protein M5G07_10670 [Serratia symbiotica]|nr:hypothetical protein [Serratia symbiotica]
MANKLIALTAETTVRDDEITRVWVSNDGDIFAKLRDSAIHNVDRQYGGNPFPSVSAHQSPPYSGGSAGMKQLIDAGNNVYVDPAEVSAVIAELQGRVCIMLRGILRPLLVRCENSASADVLAQAMTGSHQCRDSQPLQRRLKHIYRVFRARYSG